MSRRVQRSQSQQMTTQNFMPVIVRLLRETECTPAILLPEQQSSGYQVKWYRSQDHFHAKHSCRTKLFGRDTRITFNHIRKCFTEQSEEVTTPLDTVPQEESWELTPNLREASPEDEENSKQRLEGDSS